MATNLSVAFAWAILLLAATSYCVHVPLSIVCDGLKSGKLMTRYVDKNVWGKNSTWLSYRFKRQLTMLDDDLKVGELLHRCGRNKSVFLGLRLEKTKQSIRDLQYIKDRTDPIKMSINATKTKTIVSKILDDARKSRTFNFEDFLRNLQEALRASSYENGTKIGHSSTVENRSRWTEARRQIGKFQMVSEEMRRAEKRLDEKLNGSRREIVRFLDETSRRVYCMARKTSKFTRDWFLNGQGNCVFLRSEYDAGVSTLCDYALELLNTIWLALSMMGFCILVASILSCRMSSYLRGAQETFLQNRCFSDVQRYSSLQAKYNNDPAVGLEEIKN